MPKKIPTLPESITKLGKDVRRGMEAGANAVDNVAKSVESVGNHIESSSKNLEEGIRSTGDSLKSAARDATILSQIIMGVGLGGMMLLDIGFGIGNCYGSSNNQNLSDRYHLQNEYPHLQEVHQESQP